MHSITEPPISFTVKKTKTSKLTRKPKIKTTAGSFLHFHPNLSHTTKSLFCQGCACLHFFNPCSFSTITSSKPLYLNYPIEIPPLDFFIPFKIKNNIHKPPNSFQPSLLSNRTRIIKKYKHTSSKLKLSQQTIYNALYILDQLIFTQQNFTDNNKLDKFGLNALILSIKFNELEYNYESLKTIQSAYEGINNNCILSLTQIKKLEVIVLKLINYNLNSISFITIVSYFILNGILFCFDNKDGSNCNNNSSNNLHSNLNSNNNISLSIKNKQSLSLLTRKIALFIIENNIHYMEYNQFYLACAVIAYARNTLHFEKWPIIAFEYIYNVKESDFEKEYNFVNNVLTDSKQLAQTQTLSNLHELILYKVITPNKGRNIKRTKVNTHKNINGINNNNNNNKKVNNKTNNVNNNYVSVNIINNYNSKPKVQISNNKKINTTFTTFKNKQLFHIQQYDPYIPRSTSKKDSFRYHSSGSGNATNTSSLSTLRSYNKINKIMLSQSQSQNQSSEVDMLIIDSNNNNIHKNSTNKYKPAINSSYTAAALFKNRKKHKMMYDIIFNSSFTNFNNNKNIINTDVSSCSNSNKDINNKKCDSINTYRYKNKTSINIFHYNYMHHKNNISLNSTKHKLSNIKNYSSIKNNVSNNSKVINTSLNSSLINVQPYKQKPKIDIENIYSINTCKKILNKSSTLLKANSLKNKHYINNNNTLIQTQKINKQHSNKKCTNNSLPKRITNNKKKVDIIEELIMEKMLQCKKLTNKIKKKVSKKNNSKSANHSNINKVTATNNTNENIYNTNKNITIIKGKKKPSFISISTVNSLNSKNNISMENLSIKHLTTGNGLNTSKYFKPKPLVQTLTKKQIKPM
jgi:hypothetical protein